MQRKIDRRELIIGTGTAILAAGAGSTSAAPAAPGSATPGPPAPGSAAAPLSAIPPAPVARLEPVKDTYFGETLTDPYRWMENDKDADWLPSLKGQNDHTRAVLSRIPGRDALLKRIQQLSGDSVATRDV